MKLRTEFRWEWTFYSTIRSLSSGFQFYRVVVEPAGGK